ncbi:MAG: DUF4381 domain-containing protein [Ketobacter sp.]|nr:MAG: DUF4381 domain-containing protein [Ketobacter sp.]
MEQQDPLAQLKDIHLPESIGIWPPAIGWWLLAIILLALVIGGLIWLLKRHQATAYKRVAQAQLQEIESRFQKDKDYRQLLSDLSVLLKRTCITRYGRARVAGLTGKEWLKFLDEAGSTQDFTQGPGKVLVSERFQPTPNANSQALLQLVQSWLKKQS